MYDGIPYQVKQGAGDRGITAENMEKSSTPISTIIQLMKVLVWPAAIQCMAVKAEHSERMKKHVLTPLR